METNRIAYDYSFNYFGKGTYEGKPVNGASICLNIRPYKDGKEVLFEHDDEVRLGEYFLNDTYDVYFDRDRLFLVLKNEPVCKAYMDAYGWDKIEASIVGYSLDVVVGTVKDDPLGAEDLPPGFQNLPVADPVAVDKDTFVAFLEVFLDDFDIPDNKPAQVPSVLFYEPGSKEELETMLHG